MRVIARTWIIALAAWTLATAALAADPARMPFQIQADKLFVLIAVNGVPVDAMIDSGSQVSVLDAAFARGLGLRTEGRFSGVGLQGRVSGRWAKGVGLRIGEARLEGVRAGVVDLSALSAAHGRPIQATIGRELFDRYVVDIDFATQTLGLSPREGFQPPANARLAPLFPAAGRMTAEVQVDDGPPIRAVVDLGSDLPLILSPGPAARRALADGPVSTTWLGGYGAGGAGQIVTARAVRFGGETIPAVPVVAAPRSIGFGGNLGLPILRRFRLYLDFGGRRMWLGPGPALVAPFYKDRTGFNGYIEDGALRVLHVARGGPAERAGWRAGELVTAINGQSPATANAAYAMAPSGSVIEFTMAGGEKRRLTLAEYY